MIGKYITGVCQWLVQGLYLDDPPFILKVVSNDFELKEGANSCYDYLQFYDGPSAEYASFGEYCITTRP